jgi:hypothetical protein
MQFGGSTAVRRLRNGGRAAQASDEEVAGAAEFELDFALNQTPASGVGTTGGVLAASFMAFAGAIAML